MSVSGERSGERERERVANTPYESNGVYIQTKEQTHTSFSLWYVWERGCLSVSGNTTWFGGGFIMRDRVNPDARRILTRSSAVTCGKVWVFILGVFFFPQE